MGSPEEVGLAWEAAYEDARDAAGVWEQLTKHPGWEKLTKIIEGQVEGRKKLFASKILASPEEVAEHNFSLGECSGMLLVLRIVETALAQAKDDAEYAQQYLNEDRHEDKALVP